MASRSSRPRSSEFSAYREREFSWTSQRVYLNAASFGPLPSSSRTAIEEFNRDRSDLALVDSDLTAPLAAARASAARLIGVDADEIALTPNTNVAINIAATAALQRGDGRRVIVIQDGEFPANVYPWLALERSGFRIQLVNSEEELLERVQQDDVAAASVSFVQFASGFRADLRAIGDACSRTGTLFVIDAIQGLGAVPLNAREVKADILACGGQKWLCSPWGSGFAYVRRAWITRFEPLLPGWLAFEATQDFTRLTDYRYELLGDARRFETGSLGFQDYVGLNASIELLLEIGADAIWQHIRSLQQPILEWANRNEVEIVSDLGEPRRSGILCIKPRDARTVFDRLQAENVRCAFREDAIRLSPHWYNTHEEIERVVELMTR